MIFHITFDNQLYHCDTNKAVSIGISVKFNQQQPNHFGAEIASKQALMAGGFIGDTTRGGSCNVDRITMVPHCNGTHTETVSHIVHQQFAIGDVLNETLDVCRLITIKPRLARDTSDSYLPELSATDQVIDLACLQQQLPPQQLKHIRALAIRTQPNDHSKISRVYDGGNQPPFFTHQAISYLADSSISHLLVDIPSIDKMYDDGLLSNHHIYWQVKPQSRLINDDSHTHRTITEMIYVDDLIADGLYCLNLQTPAFDLDAAPSRPLLYPMTLQSTA